MPFDVHTLMDAARKLEGPSYEATRYARESGFAVSFEDAMRAVCGERFA